jgi:RNA polymerase sigma-70 factor (ECF subfamily)
VNERERTELEARIGEHLGTADFEAAAEAILRGYGVEVMSYLVAITKNRQSADDAFSTTSEDLWRGLPGFRRESSVRTWLYRLAWHAVLRQRGDAYQRRRAPLSEQLESWMQPVRSATATFLKTDVKDAVSRLREQLQPDEQTLLVLRVDRGLSWREVCQVMSTDERPVSESLLAKRFERVKAKLRRLADQSGVFPGT